MLYKKFCLQITHRRKRLKAFPLRGRWRGTRRMRCSRPQTALSPKNTSKHNFAVGEGLAPPEILEMFFKTGRRGRLSLQGGTSLALLSTSYERFPNHPYEVSMCFLAGGASPSPTANLCLEVFFGYNAHCGGLHLSHTNYNLEFLTLLKTCGSYCTWSVQ